MAKVTQKDIEKVELDSNANQVRRIQDVCRAIAESFVNSAIARSKDPLSISYEERDRKIEEKNKELLLLSKVKPEEFAQVLEKYLLSVRNKVDELPVDIQDVLKNLDLIKTVKGSKALKVSAHKKLTSTIVRQVRDKSYKDLGIEVEESKQQKSTYTAPKKGFLRSLISPSLGTFNPNTKNTKDENKLDVIDRDRYMADNEYAKTVRENAKRLKNDTTESIRLNVELRKLEKQRVLNATNTVGAKIERSKDYMNTGEKALFNMSSALISGIAGKVKQWKDKTSSTTPATPVAPEAPTVPVPIAPVESGSPSYKMSNDDIASEIEKDEEKDETVKQSLEVEKEQTSWLEKIYKKLDNLNVGGMGFPSLPGVGSLPGIDLPDRTKRKPKPKKVPRIPVTSAAPLAVASIPTMAVTTTAALVGGMAYGEYLYRKESKEKSKQLGIAVGSEASHPSFFEVISGDSKSHKKRQRVANKETALKSNPKATFYSDENGQRRDIKTDELTGSSVFKPIPPEAPKLEQKQNEVETAKADTAAKTNAAAMNNVMMNAPQISNVSAPNMNMNKSERTKDNPRNPDNSLSLFLATRVKFV